ncbi:DNA polymerase epsilon subunit C [Erysiphe necator]|nr:DNA polymerase epsilon subunit C [Erysiphe necator]
MDSTYSPLSPDLSSLLSRSPKAQQFSKNSISRQAYMRRTPSLSLDSNSLDKKNFHYAPNSYATNLSPHSPGSFKSTGESFSRDAHQTPLAISGAGFPNSQNLLPISPRNSRILAPAQAPFQTEFCVESQNFYQDHPNTSTKSNLTPENSAGWVPSTKRSTAQNTMSSCRNSREKFERKSSSTTTSTTYYADPNPQNIEIKTKFPVARIKRIMQADEEVGKVAQVTPVAVSKALELFMIALVTGAAEKAREKGSKKVSAQHLRLVVDGQPERFDFLADIVGKFGEGSENASSESNKANRKRKEESESASEEDKGIKKKGRGRKKKSGD